MRTEVHALSETDRPIDDSSFRRRFIVSQRTTFCLLLLFAVPHWRMAHGADCPPRYHGFTVKQWNERIKSFDFDSPVAADAVPGLIALMQAEELDWPTRRNAALTLGRIGRPAAGAVPLLQRQLETALTADDRTRVLWTVKGLALFGPVARDATPQLVELLNDESRPNIERIGAIDALSQIGAADPRAVGGLVQFLNRVTLQDAAIAADRSVSELHAAIIDALGLMGPVAVTAVPSLVRLTESDSTLLRHRAATTLGKIGTSAEPAIPALATRLLFDTAPEVQDAAAVSLGEIGTAAIPSLLQTAVDADPEIRQRAIKAFGTMEDRANTEPVLNVIEAAMDDAHIPIRMTAIEAKVAITGDVATALPSAVALLSEEDRQMRIAAYRFLLEHKSHASTIRRLLRRLEEKDSTPEVQRVVQKLMRDLASP